MKQAILQGVRSIGLNVSRWNRFDQPFEQLKGLCFGADRPVVFDVGAHHGLTALEFRELLPQARIFAFEPFAQSFAVMQARLRGLPDIKCFDFGLSDRAGTQSFHINPSSATNSLLATDAAASATWGDGLLETQTVVKANFKTLDQVLEDLGIAQVDILKLDVQGAEPLVIEGAARACATGKIKAVYAEVITQPTYAGQRRLDEYLHVFYGAGFDLWNLYNFSHTAKRQLRQMDAIFVTKMGAACLR